MKAKIYKRFSRLPQWELLNFAQQVFEQMTKNSALYDEHTNAEVAKLGPLVEEYHKFLKAAMSGDKEAIFVKNEQKEKVNFQLNVIADILISVYIGQLPPLKGSGFPLMTHYNKHPLGKVLGSKLDASDKEFCVDGLIKGGENMSFADVFFTTGDSDDVSTWDKKTVSTKNYELGPFKFADRLKVQVKCIGIDGSSSTGGIDVFGIGR